MTLEVGTMIISISQMRETRLGEIKQLAQGSQPGRSDLGFEPRLADSKASAFGNSTSTKFARGPGNHEARGSEMVMKDPFWR